MAHAFTERRHAVSDLPEQAEVTGIDRRQFPPPADPQSVSPEAWDLQDAIDTYKIARGLKRITVVELLGLLQDLGYRRG